MQSTFMVRKFLKGPSSLDMCLSSSDSFGSGLYTVIAIQCTVPYVYIYRYVIYIYILWINCWDASYQKYDPWHYTYIICDEHSWKSSFKSWPWTCHHCSSMKFHKMHDLERWCEVQWVLFWVEVSTLCFRRWSNLASIFFELVETTN